MSHNLLLWKWSPDFDSPAKRKRHRLKFGDVTGAFVANGRHPAIGEANVAEFQTALEAEFGQDELARPFVLETHPRCVVVNYSSDARFQLVPRIAAIGKRFGLNASEF